MIFRVAYGQPTPWRQKTRRFSESFRADWDQPRYGLGGPRGGAGFFARCGAACQAGEARALAAALRRRAAMLHVAIAGQPDAIAIFMRRTLVCTSAPIFNSLRRMVPQLALAKGV